MYHMTITANYLDTGKQLSSQRYSSVWAMQDHISKVLRDELKATSFVFTIVKTTP